ncbi:hydantoinase/oxoprolinase family protein [Solirubrobacter phytolaccae]|uniref:Hydantoinase/oxoprolinase family protein n=1 Tax=Solirubrobacter phytolaccae TaxID=1404360 RepID=A0A9X3NDK1_9ACTN|nr:hydantoinase/oxoprolinase family protein [Solirubrobacter phytolaccae]MDA0180267.1 hydantoinase/oxoprolinase family protein [Solirubrobacter phytolaccae]
MLLGVDVGGTFTDAVLAVDGRLWTAKAPTTPEDQSEGVLNAVRAVLERANEDAQGVQEFAHGTTAATNALLEGEGAKTVFVATKGFEDIIELARQARADLYRLCKARPAPLVPPELRVGATERMTPDGPETALDVDAAVQAILALEPESVAVCLLHAYRHPEHEQQLGAALEAHDVHVSLSHQVVGTFREYERAATTELDAALSPLLAAYLRNLTTRAQEAGLPEPSVMQSSGGLASLEQAADHAVLTVLSGPAGGAAGAAWAAQAAGEPDTLCFDMGGTSCDVCVVLDGEVREASGREVGGRPVALPMLDIHTVGAGGGSIAWRDAGGALRVGPRSAGARPGPAAYGHGGEEPTVTDANLLLGLLGGIAGGIELDREAAERAVDTLAEQLDLSRQETAEGIIKVANAEMVRALRVMTVERGVDPRSLALMAFGGAGGLHAAAIAEELGITKILCPRASGVLAALGLVVSERRRDAQRSVLLKAGELTTEADELTERARAELGDPEADVRVVAELRYRGQAFELSVPLSDHLEEDFHAAHEDAYGYRDPEAEVELVTLRATATTPGPEIDPDAVGRAAEGAERGTRTTLYGETTIIKGEPEPGERIEGPAVIELRESTLAVPPGWSGEVLPSGTVRIEWTR